MYDNDRVLLSQGLLKMKFFLSNHQEPKATGVLQHLILTCTDCPDFANTVQTNKSIDFSSMTCDQVEQMQIFIRSTVRTITAPCKDKLQLTNLSYGIYTIPFNLRILFFE